MEVKSAKKNMSKTETSAMNPNLSDKAVKDYYLVEKLLTKAIRKPMLN